MQQEMTAAHVAPSRSTPLVAELEEYRRQVEAIRLDVRGLLEGLNDAEFNWRAAPGSWSIAECLAHLNLTGQLYLQTINRAVGQGRRENLLGRGPYKHGWLGRLLVHLTEPPVKRVKVKAPKMIAPPPEHLLAVAAPAFDSLQEAITQTLREADGVDLGRVRITSPFSKLLRISLGQTLAHLIAHERRHLWQARQVKNDPNFPNG